MKKTLLSILTLLCALAANIAVAADAADSRIKLVVYPADSLDRRTSKQQIKINLPPFTPPHSEGDLSALSGPNLAQALSENANAKANRAREENQVAWQEYDEAKRANEEFMRKQLNTNFGRLIGNASDWFAASLGKHKDIFRIILRTDMDEGEVETNNTQDGGTVLPAKADYKIKTAVSDLKQFEETLQFPGGTRVRTTLKTVLTVRIESVSGGSEGVGEGDSFTVPIQAVSMSGSAVGTRGDDDKLDEAFQKALDDAAQKIADEFSSRLTVKIRGPQTDFVADDVTLTLDGNDIQRDAPTPVIKGKFLPQKTHTLKAELDGFESVSLQLPCNNDTTRTITMKKATDEKQSQPAK